ncbi:MAG TPA: aminodeoxychorismate lyase [Steroidobacteraceae bacterium]
MAPEDTPAAVWVNGRPGGALSPLERGLHYGDGLFETIACVGGRPRFIDLHLARLRAGCARLGIEFPVLEELRREILEVGAGAGRSIVKLVLTRGPAVARGYGTSGAEQPTRLTLRYGWEEEDPRLAADGVRVRTAGLRLAESPALAGLKHLNRLEQVLARRESPATDFEEALMFSSGGRLISGIMSNVFVVQSGALRTPLLDRCGVAGIMRQVVLREARRAGIVAVEAELEGADLERTREIFLTNAVIGLRPVRALDGRACAPGAVTRELQRRLAPLLAEATDG